MPKVRFLFILKLFFVYYVYCEDLQNGTASSVSDTKRKLYPDSLQDNSSHQSQAHVGETGVVPENLMADVLSNLHIAKEMGSLMDALQAATTKSIVVAFAKHCGNYTASNNHVVNKLRFIMQNNINVIIHRLTKSMAEFAKKTDKYAYEMPLDFCDEGQEYVIYNRMRCWAGDESCTKEFGKVDGMRTQKSIPDEENSHKNCVQTSDPSSTRRRNMPPKIHKKATSPISYEDFKDGKEIIEKGKQRNKNVFNRPEDLRNLKPQFRGTDGGSSFSSSIEIQENNPNIIENSNIRNEKPQADIVPAEENFPAENPEEDEPLLNKHNGDNAATYEYDTDDSDAIRSKSNFVPKTVKLSKANKDFYNDRKWPGGVVRYMIGNEDPKYDIANLRKRLNAVNEILKEKTCARLVEISQKAKERFNDYIVLDTSPDYITGRVGKEQFLCKMVSIGIDLGTTYCCVATWKHGMVEIIANEQGNRTTPSYVAFTSHERLIGESAKNQAPLNPKNTIYSAKRLIGRRYDDIGVQLDKRHWPFYVINDHGKPNILVQFKGEKKSFAPEEISSMILCRLKEVAEAYLGETVKHAVITVPAYFNDAQRQATRTAGVLAGLDVLRIINEPTAAAMAYGIERKLNGQKNVLIYDLGGGTFDVSVLKIDNGSVFEVMSTAGNTRLGGEDFDNRLVSYFAQDFENKYGTTILSNARALRRLRSASERAKRCLTSATEALVEIESLHDGIDYYGKVSRAMFEELCSDLFKDTMRPVQAALDDARLPKNHIHEVVLIGGSTRIPKIQNILSEFFNGKNLTSSINPDEAVAYGAAIQAAILSGNNNAHIKDVLLMDVVPLSLGVETARGLMYKVIERNTAIPCRKCKDITTLEDNQPALTIEVFEGERTLTQDNNLLGHFELADIPMAPRGVPKIEVIFDVDADGILTVTAIDKSTGNSKGIVIKNESRLRPSEIEKMVWTAKMFKEDDKERKLCLEARNQLETYIFAVRNLMKDNQTKLTEKEGKFLAKECDDAITWLDDCSDALREEFERKMTELMKKWAGYVNQLSDTPFRIRNLKRLHSEVDADADEVVNELAAIEDLFH